MPLIPSFVSGLRRMVGLPAEEASASAEVGTLLNQTVDDGEIPGYVRRVIGTFSPQLVDHTRRLQMRLDPDVAFFTAIVRAPIIKAGWAVESKDQEIAAFVEHALRPRYAELAKAGSLAMMFGFRVIEPAWKAGPLTLELKGKTDGTVSRKKIPVAWTYRKFRPIDSRTLTLLKDPRTDEFAGVSQPIAAKEGGRGFAPADRVVLWSFRDEDVDGRLDGFPLYDQAYEPWWWKAAMNLFANRYFERRADPTPKGRATARAMNDKGQQVDGYALVNQQIQAVRNGGHYVLPSDVDEKTGKYKFDVEYLEDSGRAPAAYQARIDKLGIQIGRGMLVPEESSTATEMGGRARSEVAADRLEENTEAHVQEWFDEVVNPQVVDRLVLLQYGPKALEESHTRIKAAGLSSGMRDLLKDVLFKVMDGEAVLERGGTIPMRKRIHAAEIAGSLKIPLRPEDEVREEMEAEQEEAEARQAEGEGVEITPEMEREAEEELRRRGALEDETTDE